MKISAKTVSLGNKKIKIMMLGEITETKKGLATGNNMYYLYRTSDGIGSYRIIDKTKVLTEEEISEIHNGEKLRIKIIENGIPKNMFKGKTIIPYDKGGSSDIESGRLSNYFLSPKFFIDWSESNVKRMKNLTIAQRYRYYGQKFENKSYEEKKAAVIRNPSYNFKDGITFSDVGLYSPTYRINSCSVFDHRGSCIFIKKEFFNVISINYLLGILCSKFLRYIAKHFINNTVSFQIDDTKKTPIPLCERLDIKKIENLVKEIIKKQKKDPDYNYQNHEQKEIDKIVYEIFGLNQELIDEVETWYARRYPKLVRN